jgi:D-3-phosphoglycerate dehydrogenase
LSNRDKLPSGTAPKHVVLVTGAELVPEARELLGAHSIKAIYSNGYVDSSELAVLAKQNNIDALLVRQGSITQEVINASPNLRVIAKHGSGVDNIDLNAAVDRGIPVLRAIAANSQSVAELAITLSVTLMKDVTTLNAAVKGGDWPKTKYVGRDLGGAKFGLIGFGEIGRRTARLAQGLGMTTLAYDPLATNEGDTVVTRDLDAVLAQSDIVSLHCPLLPETRRLINRERLARMKTSAFLVNTARGAIVDEDALFAALRDGVIAGAALDSFEQEPPRRDHPLWTLPNLLATPHVAAASASALRNMAMQSAQHIVNVLEGQGYDAQAIANPSGR